MSDNFESGEGIKPRRAMAVCENTYKVWVSGSYEPPGQFAPPVAPGDTMVPSVPSRLLTEGGVNRGPIRYFATSFSASPCSSGVKLIS